MRDYDALDLLPQGIDTSQPYPDAVVPGSRGDYLGGLRWCGEADRYFGPMVPVVVATAKRLRREWWGDAAATRHIITALGPHTVDLLIRWLRDESDYASVNRLSPAGARNPGWLEVQARRARSEARTYYRQHPYRGAAGTSSDHP